jgi:hypothetical protein
VTQRIIVDVSAAGIVSARTEGVLGERCLDYISVLEDMLEAETVQSAFTADYTRTRVDERQQVSGEVRNVDRA